MSDYSATIRGLSVTKRMVEAAQKAATEAAPPYTCFEEWGISDAGRAALKEDRP